MGCPQPLFRCGLQSSRGHLPSFLLTAPLALGLGLAQPQLSGHLGVSLPPNPLPDKMRSQHSSVSMRVSGPGLCKETWGAAGPLLLLPVLLSGPPNHQTGPTRARSEALRLLGHVHSHTGGSRTTPQPQPHTWIPQHAAHVTRVPACPQQSLQWHLLSGVVLPLQCPGDLAGRPPGSRQSQGETHRGSGPEQAVGWLTQACPTSFSSHRKPAERGPCPTPARHCRDPGAPGGRGQARERRHEQLLATGPY